MQPLRQQRKFYHYCNISRKIIEFLITFHWKLFAYNLTKIDQPNKPRTTRPLQLFMLPSTYIPKNCLKKAFDMKTLHRITIMAMSLVIMVMSLVTMVRNQFNQQHPVQMDHQLHKISNLLAINSFNDKFQFILHSPQFSSFIHRSYVDEVIE